jgi:hypothetical protein
MALKLEIVKNSGIVRPELECCCLREVPLGYGLV